MQVKRTLFLCLVLAVLVFEVQGKRGFSLKTRRPKPKNQQSSSSSRQKYRPLETPPSSNVRPSSQSGKVQPSAPVQNQPIVAQPQPAAPKYPVQAQPVNSAPQPSAPKYPVQPASNPNYPAQNQPIGSAHQASAPNLQGQPGQPYQGPNMGFVNPAGQASGANLGTHGFNAPQTGQHAPQMVQGQHGFNAPQMGQQPGVGQMGHGYPQPGVGQMGHGYPQPGVGQQMGHGYPQPGVGQMGHGYPQQPGVGQMGHGYPQQGVGYPQQSYGAPNGYGAPNPYGAPMGHSNMGHGFGSPGGYGSPGGFGGMGGGYGGYGAPKKSNFLSNAGLFVAGAALGSVITHGVSGSGYGHGLRQRYTPSFACGDYDFKELAGCCKGMPEHLFPEGDMLACNNNQTDEQLFSVTTDYILNKMESAKDSLVTKNSTISCFTTCLFKNQNLLMDDNSTINHTAVSDFLTSKLEAEWRSIVGSAVISCKNLVPYWGDSGTSDPEAECDNAPGILLQCVRRKMLRFCPSNKLEKTTKCVQSLYVLRKCSAFVSSTKVQGQPVVGATINNSSLTENSTMLPSNETATTPSVDLSTELPPAVSTIVPGVPEVPSMAPEAAQKLNTEIPAVPEATMVPSIAPEVSNSTEIPMKDATIAPQVPPTTIETIVLTPEVLNNANITMEQMLKELSSNLDDEDD